MIPATVWDGSFEGERMQVLPEPPADPTLAVAALNAAVAYLPNASNKEIVTQVADHFLAWLERQAGTR